MTSFEIRNGITPETYYGNLVSKKIRSRYSQDEVEALTSNYLSDPSKYKAEWDEFQAFRSKCKEEAKKELGI